jgi:prevent-host-death family protein
MKAHMSAGTFKNTCLRVMDEVLETGQEVVVTKRGRPVVRVLPVLDRKRTDNDLQGMIAYQDSDLFSTGEVWDAEDE